MLGFNINNMWSFALGKITVLRGSQVSKWEVTEHLVGTRDKPREWHCIFQALSLLAEIGGEACVQGLPTSPEHLLSTSSVLGTGVTKMNNSLSCTQEVCALLCSKCCLLDQHWVFRQQGTESFLQEVKLISLVTMLRAKALFVFPALFLGSFLAHLMCSISIWMSKWTAWWLGVN